jgi:transcriptional regulator with XRE-family HTH domain
MIGEWMRAERRRRGWSQYELAQRAGVAQAHISKIERQQRTNPSMDVLQGLARAFEMSASDLLLTADSPQSSAPDTLLNADLVRLQRIWTRLTRPDQAMILRMAESLECYECVAEEPRKAG